MLIGRKWTKTPEGLLSSGLMRSRSTEKLTIELDKEASSVHCALIVYANAVVLFDAGSTNGTTFRRHARAADVEICAAAPGDTPWIESLHGVRLVTGASFSAGNTSFELLSKPVDELPSKPVDDCTAPPFPLPKKKPAAAKRPREKGEAVAGAGAAATKPAARTAKAAAASNLDISKLFDEPDPHELKQVFLLAGKARQLAASKRRSLTGDIEATQAENSQEAAWAGVDHPDPGSCATCAVPPEIATAFQVYRRIKANQATTMQVADSIKALEAALTIISQARGALAYHLAGGMAIATEEKVGPRSDVPPGVNNVGAATSSKRPWLSADNGALSQDNGSLPRMDGETPREEAHPEPITDDVEVVEILASSAEGAEAAVRAEGDVVPEEVASPASENVRKMARDLGLRVDGRRRETLAADVRFALASAEEADTDIEERASIPDESATDGGIADQLALFVRSVPRLHEAAMLGELRLVHVLEAVKEAGITIAKDQLVNTLSTLGVEIIT